MNAAKTYALGNAGSVVTTSLLSGDAGTAQTIAAIREQVDAALRDPWVRQTAGWIVERVREHDELGEVRAVYEWVRQHIRYVKDPIGKETLSSARWTLSHGFGDCDDINAILLPALAGVIGYPVRLVTISQEPGDFSHVYAEVFVAGRWIPLDAARPGARFGTAPAHYARKRVWSLTDSEFQDVRGLNGVLVNRGLGFDWDAFRAWTRDLSTGIANIFASQKTGLPPTQFPGVTALPPVPEPTSGIPTGTLLLVGIGVVAVVVLATRK